jgi:hypothetical protein
MKVKIHKENSIKNKVSRLNNRVNYNLIFLGGFLFVLGYLGYIEIALLTFGFYLSKRA